MSTSAAYPPDEGTATASGLLPVIGVAPPVAGSRGLVFVVTSATQP